MGDYLSDQTMEDEEVHLTMVERPFGWLQYASNEQQQSNL